MYNTYICVMYVYVHVYISIFICILFKQNLNSKNQKSEKKSLVKCFAIFQFYITIRLVIEKRKKESFVAHSLLWNSEMYQK